MSLKTFQKLLQPTRVNEYRNILTFALNNGYRVTSLIDWFTNDFYKQEKVLVLRHDVDLISKTAEEIFNIEKELGVKSTFYFRWSTMNDKLMHKIKDKGFEVSLHFETLATYCKHNRIKSSLGITNEVLNICKNNLLEEKESFEKKFWRINSLCSHGDFFNRIIGIPNWKIIEGVPRKEIGILFETYDKIVLDNFDNYVSDSSFNMGHKWQHGIEPEKAVAEGKKSICLLTHPNHWIYSPFINLSRFNLDLIEYIKLKTLYRQK